ncbi:MAG TPA: ABC transporter substrate-binding protein [Gaiellaceae bacterium]|nr:ABC transporter substrate-binding protein [Gaiellaceae bacterium]
MLRRALVVAALAFAWAGTANAATPQQLTLTMSDGTQLACSLTLPDAPATPSAGVILFHGLGGKHQDMEPIATQFLAPAGYAALACDARGHGASQGQFGLDGPRDVADTRELYDWFAARIGTQQIGALGVSLGGGAVWNALTAGVPFKAAVPIITWTNLLSALAPQGLSKSGLVQYLAGLVPTSRWDPQLLAAAQGLTTSADLTAATALSAARSETTAQLRSITTPTLLVQGRHDFLFDVDQALAAYRSLGGPKALYLGDVGHLPAANPSAEQPTLYGLAVKWFDRYLKGTPNGVDRTKVVLAHDPWDGRTTAYAGVPPTKRVTVNLPGTTTITGATGKVVRSVRITGGPHETFGDSTVTVRYSNAKSFDHLVAVLAVQGSSTPISAGGTKLKAASGTATIRLLDEVVRVPAGKKLVLYLSSTSLAQSPSNALYVNAVQPDASVTIGRTTLALSVLKRAVSRAGASRRLAGAHATPGLTKTQIVLGGTGPLTGSESAYEPVLSGAKAYFDYVNARGGVYGRKIVYKVEDDQYDPVQTVQKTQKLVEQDGVFAIFNSVGTEHALAVRDWLNARKVPQLFVGSGAAAIGTEHAKYPWTVGLLPSFVGEGAIYGKLIAKQHPNAKIGVLYENDEYGQELLRGLKRGLGRRAGQIVSTQGYALLDTDVISQVQSLKASGADTFVIFALPKQAIQAFVGAAKLGWKPFEYVTSVSIDPAVMQIVRLNAGAQTGAGATSSAFLHDPTNPTQKGSAGVKLYLQIMKRYLPGEDPRAVAHIYGMMAAYAMVDALKHAGRNPTRASLLKAATHLHETNPFLLPGLELTTSPKNYFPIQRTYLVRFQHGFWNVLGRPLAVPSS